MREGLAHECKRCFKELKQTASLYEATRHLPNTLTLRFEELVEGGTSSFDSSVSRMLRFAGLAPSGGDVRGQARFSRLMASMQKHDLSRRPANTGTREAGHVSNKDEKASLRAALLEEGLGVADELRKLRQRMQYTSADGEGLEARKRRWRLAAMLK